MPSLSGGYIDIDVNQSAGDTLIYDGVRVPSTDVEIIAAEFAINTYRVLIQNQTVIALLKFEMLLVAELWLPKICWTLMLSLNHKLL